MRGGRRRAAGGARDGASTSRRRPLDGCAFLGGSAGARRGVASAGRAERLRQRGGTRRDAR
eukprot:1425216-Prymnesium_polylepis.1